MKYDAERAPTAQDWLEIDELERIGLVESFHRRTRVRLPNVRLHATIHVIVENQLALGEQPVIDALVRLQSEGLTRHEAIHAIGLVLTEQMQAVVGASGPASSSEVSEAYLAKLRALKAQDWRNAG